MLSVGGDSLNEGLPDDDVATWFADFLWYSFGPYNPSATKFPRPFHENSVDGFDLDIENGGSLGKFAPLLTCNKERTTNVA